MANTKLSKKDSYKTLFGYVGIFLIMIGIILFLPLFTLIFYPKEYIYIHYFLIPSGIALIIGLILFFTLMFKKHGKLEKNHNMILVIFIWILAFFFGSIPFLFFKISFTNAIFESTSAFTTTGFSSIEAGSAPMMLRFFRVIMNFFGGVGIIMIISTAISLKSGVALFEAEGHEGFMPSLIKSAKVTLLIFSYFILIGTLLFMAFGMKTFDAIYHAIAAVSTGGFSTKAEAFAGFNNIAFEIIAIVLMLLGATNFVTFNLIFRGKGIKVLRNMENYVSLIMIFIIIPMLILSLKFATIKLENGGTLTLSGGESVRYSFFYYTSGMSTAGFSSKYTIQALPELTYFLLLLTMLIGGQGSSTAGGIKHIRLAYILKGFKNYLTKPFRSKRTIKTKHYYYLGEKRIFTEEKYHESLNYALLYLAIAAIGTGLLLLGNLIKYDHTNFRQSLFNFVSSLSNVGLNMGDFALSTKYELWIYIFGMFLGRLEILPIFVGITKLFKDIFRHKKVKVDYNV